MEENFVKIKSHLIITDIENNYTINWCGKLIDSNPILVDGLPVFIIIGSNSRIEMNTIDMSRIENCAKKLTCPKGRAAVTSDTARVYLKEVGRQDRLMCVVTHKRIKHYAPMFDKVGWK